MDEPSRQELLKRVEAAEEENQVLRTQLAAATAEGARRALEEALAEVDLSRYYEPSQTGGISTSCQLAEHAVREWLYARANQAAAISGPCDAAKAVEGVREVLNRWATGTPIAQMVVCDIRAVLDAVPASPSANLSAAKADRGPAALLEHETQKLRISEAYWKGRDDGAVKAFAALFGQPAVRTWLRASAARLREQRGE